MTNTRCLNEELLIDLYYGEQSVSPTDREHVVECPSCRTALEKLGKDLEGLADPIPAAGERALAGAMRLLGIGSKLPTGPEKETLEVSGPGQNEVMTLTEVAAYLRVHPEQVRQMIGSLPHLNIGGSIRVRRKALEEHLVRMERGSIRGEAEREDPVKLRRDLI